MRASSTLPVLSVMVLFALLTLGLGYPLSTEPGSQAFDLGPDTRLFLWTLGWDTHALTSSPLRLFDANIFYPEHRTLAYSEHQLGSALLAAPVLKLTGNPLLAMNIVLLFSCIASAAGAFFLARQLGVSVGAAILAGVIFAFTPPRFFRLGQLHLATVQWIPFCLAFIHRYANGGTRRDIVAAIAFFSLQAWSGGQSGLFLAVAGALLLSYLMLFGAFRPRGVWYRDAALALGLGAILNVPFLLPYLKVQEERGLSRSLDEAIEWSPNWESFLASPTHAHRWLLRSTGLERTVGHNAKAYLFPGYTVLLLAFVGMFWRRPEPEKSPDSVRGPPSIEPSPVGLKIADAALVVLALTALAIEAAGGVRVELGGLRLSAASGARVAIAFVVVGLWRLIYYRTARFAFADARRTALARLRDGFDSRAGVAAGFYSLLAVFTLWLSLGPGFGLYTALYRLVPGFDFIRVPSRWTLLTMLSLALLAAVGADRLAGARARRVRVGLVAFLISMLVLEFAAVPLQTKLYPLTVSSLDRWLANSDSGGPILVLPVPDPRDGPAAARQHSAYMLGSRVHWRPLVNGYSGFTPPAHDRLFRDLVRFPDDATLQALEEMGVELVVLHAAPYGDAWEDVVRKLDSYEPRLRLVADLDEGRIYELTNRSRPHDRESSAAL